MVNRFFGFLLLIAVAIGCLPLLAKEESTPAASQQTLAIIKPDAVADNKVGAIIANIEGTGLHVAALRMTWLTQDQAALFYAAHKDRPFYKSLINYMSSGPIVIMVLQGEDSVDNYRKLMGATDPAKALPGTLRREFGTNVEKNAVHGSDAPESAKKEISFFFTEGQIYN